MKAIQQPGCVTALVHDAAFDEVRLPDELHAESKPDEWNLFLIEPEHTLTLEEYWTERNREPTRQTVMLVPAVPADDEPYDSYTIDAEIRVERVGLSAFATADLAALLGVSGRVVRYRMFGGLLPAPRWPAHNDPHAGNVPHRWTATQVVGVLARQARDADAALEESA